MRASEAEFNIQIKDNFLSEKDFKIISDIGNKVHFKSNDISYHGKEDHVWFSANAPPRSVALKVMVSVPFQSSLGVVMVATRLASMVTVSSVLPVAVQVI